MREGTVYICIKQEDPRDEETLEVFFFEGKA